MKTSKPSSVPLALDLPGKSSKSDEQFTGSQVVLFIFVVLFLAPQFYVLSRPKSSRFCEKPLLENLIAFIVFSFIATGLAVAVTLTDPVPKSIKAAFHTFGLFSFIQGLCTAILTLNAPQCANTTTELYILSLVVTWACIFSTAFFVVRGALCLIHQLFPHWLSDRCLWD
ncbi:hypothetical protein DNTS_000593 [Danionella cerebrum]|uniref:Uncharacterized protein n=1 Tax=Danionella cerebrum TaxID=2873325 RepID=A0A553NWK3_9TELE|nr:hypothetical protein DNTS_000593 [Danionella translucida]TRY69818.1 hypothetical protein DNTS_000593 [Danionella translucida]TRY69819.1 hypothetical protein DNTS_000593 [Danionella translucida]